MTIKPLQIPYFDKATTGEERRGAALRGEKRAQAEIEHHYLTVFEFTIFCLFCVCEEEIGRSTPTHIAPFICAVVFHAL